MGMIGFITESQDSATSKVPTALSILDQTFKPSVAQMATPGEPGGQMEIGFTIGAVELSAGGAVLTDDVERTCTP